MQHLFAILGVAVCIKIWLGVMHKTQHGGPASMRHLRLYRAIRLILREGSIRKAAEILAISPSALNRSILSFEEELGVEIFDRMPGGVVPSVAGELLFRHLDEHVSRMDDFLSLVSEMKHGAAGTLRLSVSGDLAETLLPEALQAFRRANPSIALSVREDEGPEALLTREVDLALVTRPETGPGLEVVMTHAARVIGRVAPQHPRAGLRLGVADLAEHAVLMPPPGGGLRAAVDHGFRRSRLSPRVQHDLPRLAPVLGLDEVQMRLWWREGLPESPGAAPGVAHVDLSPLRVPPVQITLMRREGGHLPRPAEVFHAALARLLG